MKMKRIALSLFLGCWALIVVVAQTDGDTTVYKVVEEMPRFPACEKLDTTLEFKIQCAQQQLLAFMAQNVIYPMEARQNGNEGTVVINFVVEKDGSLTVPRIIKDIGGGCGIEALRMIGVMNQVGIRWVPGKIKGKAVRTQYNLPVRFRLKEAPPYTIVAYDTIWTTLDTPLEFEGGSEALTAFLNTKIKYPASGNDSCRIGQMDVQIMVDRQGDVRVLDITDYNDLGFDFWSVASETVIATSRKWKIASYQNQKVPAAYDIVLTFFPEAENCKAKVDSYQKAAQLANEGLEQFNKGEKDAGINKMSEALALFPNDANFLYARGQSYLEMQKFPEACADLSKVKAIASVDWFDTLLPIICR